MDSVGVWINLHFSGILCLTSKNFLDRGFLGKLKDLGG